MRIQIGTQVTQYFAALATVALGIFSALVAALIGRGPVSLLLFFLAMVFLVLGIVLVLRIFSEATALMAKQGNQPSKQRNQTSQNSGASN